MEAHSLEGMAAFIRRMCTHLLQPQGAPCCSPAALSKPYPPTSRESPAEPAGPPQPAYQGDPVPGNDGEADWALAEQARDSGEVQEATIVGWNRGGLLAHWRGLQGFLPASQLQRMIHYSCDDERDAAFAGRVGEMLQLRVIEVDRSRKRLVFSERALQWGPSNGQCLWDELEPGQVRRGRVRNLCNFGAFVDLGGIDGLIHISELSWRHIRHPSEVLQIGQDIDAYVMAIEPKRKRVALSLKKLTADPWQTVGERYQPGQIVQGTVTNVLNFGAFVHIEDGIEGLIHVSEFGNGAPTHPRDHLAEGDQVSVRIIDVDAANRRLALSLRQ